MKRRQLRASCTRGQAIVEFSMMLPLILVLVLGVVELGYALLDQHVVTKLTREGSNLISRDVTLQDALAAMRGMSTRPLNFDDGSSRVIFSVIQNGATTGTANYGQNVLYQRYEYGTYSGSTALTTAGVVGSPGGAPDYRFPNTDTNTSLRVTNLPAGVLTTPGGMLYVTEILTRHTLITPFDRFGISVPTTLYSIAYF